MAKWSMVVADLHAGSNYALIPPVMARQPMKRGQALHHWTLMEKSSPGYIDMRLAAANAGLAESRKFWGEFMAILRKLPPIDHCFILSDNIEGKQEKSAGVGLLSSSIKDQTLVANFVLDVMYQHCKWKHAWGVDGTEYHTGEDDSRIYERVPNMRGYDGKLFVQANGLIWRLQHHIGRSGTPYGKQTPLSKAMIYNQLLADSQEIEADVCLFGHTHYCVSSGFPMKGKRAFTCPCLKLRGERYGNRFQDFYHVGLILFKQEKDGAPVQEYVFEIPVSQKPPRLFREDEFTTGETE